ncbi:MAG: histidine phosphatase family protein [Myxococcota bacterium]
MQETGQPEAGSTARREASQRGALHPRITLLRHGEPDWSPGNGPSVRDPALTPYGRAQAQAAAARLSLEPIDAIYVSPTRRSLETAAPLAEATGLELTVVHSLAEIETGAGGLSQSEVDRYFIEGSQRPLVEHWEGWPSPEAESFLDFHARISAGIADVLSRHGSRSQREHDFEIWNFDQPGPQIVIAAHCGTNAVAITHLLDIRPRPWEWLRFESELAAYSVLQARELGPRGSVWSLQNFNEVDHLLAAGVR